MDKAHPVDGIVKARSDPRPKTHMADFFVPILTLGEVNATSVCPFD
jgi:hypothetical protein